MSAPTHLFFDFFGTLVTYSPSRIDQGYARSHALLTEAGASLFYESFLQRWDAIGHHFEQVAQRTLDEYSMDQICGEFLLEVLPRPPSDELLGQFRDVYLDEWNKGVKYITGVDRLLADLSGSFTLALVTNTHHAPLVQYHLIQMGTAEAFTTTVTSIEHGRRKPDPSIFHRALHETGGTADSCVYVGDSFAADYRGAFNAGIACLLIDPLETHDVSPSHRIGDIHEVSERLIAL